MRRSHIHLAGLTPERVAEAEAFIRENLPLTEVPGTGIRLHLAGPRSGLRRLVPPGGTPYWSHAWPGGVALAMHLLAHPEAVKGRLVTDLGTGCGLVAIAAMRAGAEGVVATDPDPLAAAAARVNAQANGLAPFPVLVAASGTNPLKPQGRGKRQRAVLAGDVFYSDASAAQITVALDVSSGAFAEDTPILIGDIGRRFLPRDRLEPLASYPVRDVGDPPSAPPREGWVFRWRPQPP